LAIVLFLLFFTEIFLLKNKRMQRLAIFQLGNKVNRAFALIRKATRPENEIACIDRDYRNNVVLMDRRFLSDLRSDEKKTDSVRNTTKKKELKKDDSAKKIQDSKLIFSDNRKISKKADYYVNKIIKLADSGDIKKAIDVFYNEMPKDGFEPTLRLYKILMHQLAKKGYTHMVFTMFKQVTLRYDRFLLFS
jgi:pentatricopeptide repeat protein